MGKIPESGGGKSLTSGGRRWRGFAIFLDETARILLGEADRQPVVQVPGLVFVRAHHGEVRLAPAPGQIKKIGLKDGGLKEVLILADGGYHEFPPGGAVFHLIE